MAAVEVDVTVVPEYEDVQRKGLTLRVMQRNGPAGGNSLIRLYGPMPLINMWLEHEYQGSLFPMPVLLRWLTAEELAYDHVQQQLGWLDDAALHFGNNQQDGGVGGLEYLSAALYALSAQLEQHFNPPNFPLLPWRHAERRAESF